MTKLNVGCGKRALPGYIGVDAVKRPAADIVAPANKIPVGDNSAEEILAIHLWEHFYRWECDAVIEEWKRILVPGGRLVLELPNLRKCCENLLIERADAGKTPDQLSYWGLYGDPRDKDPYMTHRWGWTPETLTEFLKAHGFREVRETVTQFHLVGRANRDMRIEAIR